ncbi:MAG: hypothetical protein QGH60_20555 [Phycisphaerae bacterium]|jgi:hypothetical protein|nr:hypothetical protein [Phycisphaerae bacterium]
MSSDDLEYSETNDDDGEDDTELVAAVFARDAEDAQRYCDLLADHGIVGIVADNGVETEDAEVRVNTGEGVGMTRGVAVLVEEVMLDEAGLVISDREDLAEFRFDEDDETEDDDDELDFAQGIDSELDEDIEVDDADAPRGGHDVLGGASGEDAEVDDDEFEDKLDDELDDEFDEY